MKTTMSRMIAALWMLAAALACFNSQAFGAATAAPASTAADPAMVVSSVQFQASDGAQLFAFAFVGGVGDQRARPVIIEFSPYAPACCGSYFGPDYTYVQVHARGTGRSTGVWSAVGPRDQQDVAEFLSWACHQPWSNGRIGLYGFSASAIAVYNSMHLPLACVDAAALMAGTADLYRDLLYPGGIPNLVPDGAVAAGVGVPLLLSQPAALFAGESIADRLQSGLGLLGLFVDVLAHPKEDDYWQARTHRPGPNRFPVLADTSFYDPEPRGPFESYKLLRDMGVPVHLLVFGAHDGFPTGTPGPFPQYQRWFDHYLRAVDNGVDRDPAVQMLVGNGSFEALKSGDLTAIPAADWPVPGTRWQRLYLDPARGGGALSLNNGTLGTSAPVRQAVQPYLSVASLPTATDPHTTGTIAAAGAGSLFAVLPVLTQLKLMEPLSLTYTTPALSRAVNVVGPASLDLFVSTITPAADLYAVLADVWPDGTSHAVGVGRLRSSFPDVIAARSVTDARGEVIQPYGDYSEKSRTLTGKRREYHVEFWPIGNRFQAGHRLRLYLLGDSAFSLPAPGINLVAIGGDTPSRLLLPILPDSDFCAAIGADPSCGN